MKKLVNMEKAIPFIKDGSVVLVGGFMTLGTPEPIIGAIVKKGIKDLTIICNDGGYENKRVGKLISNGHVKK